MSVSYHQLDYRRGRWARRARRLGLLAALALTSMGLAQAGGRPTIPAYAAAAAAGAPAPPPVLFGCDSSHTSGVVPQYYQAPSGVSQLHVIVNGASGGGDLSTRPALGAQVSADLTVQPGESFEVEAGCTTSDTTGGVGFSTGGQGGGTGASLNFFGEPGGGGGGSTAILYNATATPILVAGGGGGIGGGSGSADSTYGGAGGREGNDGHTGHGSSCHAGHGRGGAHWNAPGPDGQNGYGTNGAGGGGGGGGGYPNGGSGGRGGSAFGCGGGGGGGGQSYAAADSWTTNVRFTTNGAPSGDGSVLIVPVLAGESAPQMTTATCNGSGAGFTTPRDVYQLQAFAIGASGGDGSAVGTTVPGGRGAEVQATIATTSGTQYTMVAGCTASGQFGGSGYGRGGDGGAGSGGAAADPGGAGGGGGSALLLGSQPIVVAGGGGGGGGQNSATPGSGGAGSLTGDRGGDSADGSSGGAGGAAGGNDGNNGFDGGRCTLAGGAGVGGGGGGYRGGDGGRSHCNVSGGGGGGGSSFAVPAATNVAVGDGVARGAGVVIIEWTTGRAPSAPTQAQATGSALQASVSFATPADDGGLPITSYTVTSSPDGITVTGTGSPIVVTGLNRQVRYTFTVHATNAAGDSPESAPSNAVQTVFVPDRPAIVSTVGGDSSATVTFTPPASDGGRPITRYTAIARPGAASSGPSITASGTGSPLTIGGLTNGTLYTISVYATNALGNGPESVASFVQPLGLPGAPTGVGATLSPLGMSVAFTPPRATGGAPVTGYTVTASPGGITATGTTSPIVVQGLTNGVSYTFTAHATTSAGNGPESAPSDAVTWVNSTALSPPLYPSALAGNQQATVSFLPPLDDGGSPVTSYTVTSSPGGITATGTTTSITVTGLTNGVSYTFAVVAANAHGTSQPSQSNAVTPSARYGPPNDDFANAQPISSTSGTVTGTNVQATKEPGEPAHDGDPGGASVWYVWTAPANVGGSVTFDTCGSDFSTLLAAYQGDAVGALSQVSTLLPGNAPGCSAGGRTIRFDVPYSGGTFYIAVDGASSPSGPAAGNIVLHWTQSV